jgi:hypothetical protein
MFHVHLFDLQGSDPGLPEHQWYPTKIPRIRFLLSESSSLVGGGVVLLSQVEP